MFQSIGNLTGSFSSCQMGNTWWYVHWEWWPCLDLFLFLIWGISQVVIASELLQFGLPMETGYEGSKQRLNNTWGVVHHPRVKVLQKCADIIAPRLLCIYRAILQDRLYFKPWREFIMVVLRKPGKPSYEVPKAYRPIALISTMAKVLTLIVAENLSQLVERHRLLPRTHFGGRPGKSTVNTVHYLVHKIRSAWRSNKVISVLFLDVEGAFPNAVMARLIHNLKKRRIPGRIIKFIELLLTNRKTKLKFDDFISDVIDITNRIQQGDPLPCSYIYYIMLTYLSFQKIQLPKMH